MNLVEALQVRPGDVISFVGAGGKTTAMFNLATQLAKQGWRVITTTTTRIAQDEMRAAPQQVGFGHGMRLPESLPAQIEQHHHIFVFTKLENDNKVKGVRPEWLDQNLAAASYLDVLIVEADGSRRLPMKAPLSHEPPIPASTTIVVPVVGIDALGQPLDEDHIYGADIISRLTGHPPKEPVTPELIAASIMHPQIGLKNVPQRARVVPLINKVTPETLATARKIACYMLSDLNIDRVVLAALQNPVPVIEVRRRIGAVIMAAGESRRMGEPKLLMPWEQKTIIRQVAEQVTALPDVYETVVISGRWDAQIRAQLADLPLRVVFNPDYETGEMASSLKVAIESLWHSSDACLIVLGDQPMIRQQTIRDVILAYSQGKAPIVAPSFENRRGHPILIDRAFWPALLDLPPNGAPRDVIRANEDQIFHLLVDNDSILKDIDTPEDYRRATSKP